MSMYSVYHETYILLATIYGGLLIGFIYDLYKVFRRLFHPKKVATYLQDILFWSIISVVSFYVLIISNQGDLRFYNFIGFVVGVLVYHYLLSKKIIQTLLFIIRVLGEFFRDLWQLFLYPLKLGFCLINIPYSYCKKKTKPLYYKSKRVMKIPHRFVHDIKKSFSQYIKKQ